VLDQKMRRPRARYGSLKSKPWERMGISKSSWYRNRVAQIEPAIDPVYLRRRRRLKIQPWEVVRITQDEWMRRHG